MERIYKLENGKRIKIYFREGDFKLTGSVLDEKENAMAFEDFSVILIKDADGNIFFEYDGEKVYVEDYEALQIYELNNKLDEEGVRIKKSELLSTCTKYSDSVGFLINVDNKNVLYELSEKEYSKYEWKYRVTLMPVKEWQYPVMDLDFESLTESINSGEVKIVNKQKYMLNSEFQKVFK